MNYSTTDINVQIHKLISYPLYLILMTIFSGIIMLNSKKYKSNTLKISAGLFMCVIIYYLNNIFNVMGATEKINYIAAVWMPLLFLLFAILILVRKINEK